MIIIECETVETLRGYIVKVWRNSRDDKSLVYVERIHKNYTFRPNEAIGQVCHALFDLLDVPEPISLELEGG